MFASFTRRIALAATFAASISPALAQVPNFTLPPQTVIGRSQNGTGPAQAIPFNVLIAAMLQSSLTIPTVNTNSVIYKGSTSGQATISAQAVAGTPTIKWPTQSGTVPTSATSPILLDAVTGVVSCPTCATSTSVASPIVATRSAALALNLSAYTGIRTLGRDTVGDGGYGDYVKVGSQPFCGAFNDTASFQDAVGNWFQISGLNGYNFKQFGAKFDWNQVAGTGTDDTAAVQSAIDCAGVQSGPGTDRGGGAGRAVRLPAGWSLISNTITVRNQVPVIGHTPVSSGFVMAAAFPAAKHFFILGDQFSKTSIFALQSVGSGGTPFTLNGDYARSGAIYFLQSQRPCFYAGSNNSGINFTITGTDSVSAAQTDTFAGPTAGSSSCSTKDFLTITRIETNGATSGTVSAGVAQFASMGVRLQDLQLFSGLSNATQFSTTINVASGLVTGKSGNAMVYTNSAQHTAGLERVKIFAGNRSATLFEIGVGGASSITFKSVETFNVGNCGGCASNNPQIYWNYAGLAVDMENIVQGAPGVASAGSTSLAMLVEGGFINLRNWHPEGMATGVRIAFPNINAGSFTLMNGIGNTSLTDFIKIDAGVAASSTNMQGVYGNGATHTVNNNGSFTTGNLLGWASF